MKLSKLLLFALAFVPVSIMAQDKEVKTQVVEASCGQCKFGLSGNGCSLAVKVDGKAYYVDGSHMNDHGDAHAHNGMCNVIRKAEVAGEVKDGKYVASHFELLPEEK